MSSYTTSRLRNAAVVGLVLLALGAAYAVMTNGWSFDSPDRGASSSDVTGQTTTSPATLDDSSRAPDFQLEQMDGETFQLSDHFGKVIVLNFWATWCAPCREEIPDFIDMQKEYREQGLLFVGVAEDKKGWEVVRPFATKMEINYPIVVDDGTVASKYGGIRGLPTSFIIGRDGEVHNVVPGMMPRQLLESELTKLLADPGS